MKQIVSLSGGKDSTAMLLKMLERNEQIDEIIFCDTTVEFTEMYAHLKQLESEINLPITRLEPEHDFEYYLTAYQKTKGKKRHVMGYGFPTAGARWCTALFKRDAIKRYLRNRYPNEQVCQCIGIALDESKRINKELLAKKLVRYPLIEYNMTEKDALDFCYSMGYNWGGGFIDTNKGYPAGVVPYNL